MTVALALISAALALGPLLERGFALETKAGVELQSIGGAGDAAGPPPGLTSKPSPQKDARPPARAFDRGSASDRKRAKSLKTRTFLPGGKTASRWRSRSRSCETVSTGGACCPC